MLIVFLKPYVLETLEEFKNKNIKMAIATATDENLVSMALNRLGVKDYFEFIQTLKCWFVKANQNFLKLL